MANKLIGTNANQVPSNADLGTAAYMDEKELLTARGSSLSEVNKIIDTSARAVFVYDTRNDSDGGAWRKRTSGTSWYNERLNTNVRGSKREFPQVAIIVCGQQTTTIYDGDTPDLPMWMHFSGNHMLQAVSGSYPRTDIHALNGIMVGTAIVYGNAHINFILDQGDIYWNDSTRRMSNKGISERNTSQAYTNDSSYGVLSHHNGNSVDMIVTPNTPIDRDMKLPRPTIGIANAYGLNRINDAGKVAGRRSDNLGTSRPFTSTCFVGIDQLGYNVNNGTVQRFVRGADKSGNFDNTLCMKYNYTINGGHASTNNVSATLRASSDTNAPTAIGDTGFVTTGTLGASVFRDGDTKLTSANTQNVLDHQVSHITSRYNTGCMWGDIRSATMMDTRTESLNQHTRQLVADPGFNTDLNWTTIQSNATATRTAGIGRYSGFGVVLTSSGGSNIYSARQITGLIVGKQYHFSIDYDNRNHQTGIILNTGWANSGTSLFGANTLPASASGVWEVLSGSFIATQTSVWLNVYAQGTIYVDNLHLYEAEDDRSVSGEGFAPYGNLKKKAVAPGAELVSYSGFSQDNYLQLKNTSKLQFGTDAWYLSIWFKGDSAVDASAYEGLVHFNSEHSTSDDGFQILVNPTNKNLYFYAYGSSNDVNTSTGNNYLNKEWHQAVVVVRPGVSGSVGSRVGGSTDIFIDGKLVQHTTTDPGSFNNAEAFLTLGKWDGNTSTNYHWRGELSLFKIGAGDPSGVDIEEMYYREKRLFQPNAKCTLYGDNTSVVACAYDKGTDKTYIGTSDYVSVFEDLVRVDYTEGGISHGISAVNGVVVEE